MDSEFPESLRTKAKPSTEVERFYVELEEDPRWRVGAILELVRAIRAQPWCGSVYPSTSHEVLCLARAPVFEWGKDMLQVGQSGNALVVSPAGPQPSAAH